MSEKTKKALIALVAFAGGLLSGLVGGPYAGLVEAGTKVATEAIEAAPTKPEAPVAPVAPAAPAPEAKVEAPAAPAPAAPVEASPAPAAPAVAPAGK